MNLDTKMDSLFLKTTKSPYDNNTPLTWIISNKKRMYVMEQFYYEKKYRAEANKFGVQRQFGFVLNKPVLKMLCPNFFKQVLNSGEISVIRYSGDYILLPKHSLENMQKVIIEHMEHQNVFSVLNNNRPYIFFV